MRNIWKPFQSLYFAALMMLIGSGLLSTYLALRLNASGVAQVWGGALMAANALGMGVGARSGYWLIGLVGHARAFVVSAGVIVTAV
ncbi:MFS transporter, partial [Klebsiella pneumoniae]|nr:MFS transporter [Klebsiella pneumoniae]